MDTKEAVLPIAEDDENKVITVKLSPQDGGVSWGNFFFFF